MYVTDYITKSSLKTHIMFDALCNIFDKHSDIISSSLSEKEKARKIMNKIVNALSVKSEMGGPMVCMYLLNNPDHYTNHTFIPFYWYSYVVEAQNAWESPKAKQPEKVTLVRNKSRIVGLSPIYDYIYRPSALDYLNLYDWVQQCKRQKYNPKSKRTKPDRDSDDEHGDDSNHDLMSEDCIPDILPKSMFKFKNDHPLSETHVTVMHEAKPNCAVNFIGHILPRSDQGDREFYCLTMLSLFKPWRSGLDLKPANLSWDQMFLSYVFTPRQQQLMNNFNIKYECLDARDDYHAQMAAGNQNWPVLNIFDPGNADNMDNGDDDFDPFIDATLPNAYDEPNPSHLDLLPPSSPSFPTLCPPPQKLSPTL